MRFSEVRRKISVLLLAVALAAFAASGIVFGITAARAEDVVVPEAHFVMEDRETQGFWYNDDGKDDTVDNGLKENAANRNYGKDGLVLFFHGLRQNGQQSLDVEFLNDFTDNSDGWEINTNANYTEYPSYVTGIEGNITSINDDPFGYWMNTPQTLDQSLGNAKNGLQPLPIEGVALGDGKTWSHGGFGCEAGGITEFTVQVNDNNLHRVTYYVGSPWRHKYQGNDTQHLRIYDLDGNLLAEHAVLDANQGVYVQFLVRGSFKIQFNGESLTAYSNGMFFDPYTENTEIGTSGLSAQLTLPKTVDLNWTNKSADTYTSIFRREKTDGDTYSEWEMIAEVGKGVNTYKDEATNVSTSYEYALASGTVFEKEPQFTYTGVDTASYKEPFIRVRSYNLPDFTNSTKIDTAAYNSTALSFDSYGYAAEKGEKFKVGVTLTKEENGKFVPFENVEVTITIVGDNVYSDIGAAIHEENMDPIFGKGTTEADGSVEIEGSIPFAGDYELVASIEVQPDDDPKTGYDACEATSSVTVTAETGKDLAKPFISSISDAVKPGDTVYLVGNYLQDDGELKIAFAKNEGREPVAFEEHGGRFYYLEQDDILYTDTENGTGIMFTFPEDMDAGWYDFYVCNRNGWGNGITMNAARPLFLDEEGAYEGSEIQIVGRNFLQNEYGVGDDASAFDNLKVKITQVANQSGASVSNGMSYTLTVANGGILTGNKVSAKDALTYDADSDYVDFNGDDKNDVNLTEEQKLLLAGEAIPYTYSLRITIKIPKVYSLGTYEVSVAADGKDFRGLSDNCKLVIYDKKAADWDETVFGSDAGKTENDPLGIGAYWAQDLNYTKVTTMSATDPTNTFATASAYTDKVNSAIEALSNAGGGVLYFPAGTYFLFSNVTLKSNVIIVGAGSDAETGTRFVFSDNTGINKVWFKAGKEDNNIGLARVYLDGTNDGLKDDAGKYYAPKFVVQWSGNGTGTLNSEFEDTTITNVKNRFIVDVNADMYAGETVAENGCNRNISIGGKNCVIKDCDLRGILISTELNSYGQMWNVKMVYEGALETSPHWMGRYVFMENCYFDMCGMGHGPSVKSNQYMAFSYTLHAGNRENPTNDGEVMLMEAPTGAYSTGMVLDATARTITLDFTGGQYISDTTSIRYNMCAVYISDGTGAGQYRYIKKAGTGTYGNTYELMDWEKDWDILPDHTSVFAVIAPLENMTVYNWKAYDCVSSLTFYSNCLDVVIEDCTLIQTAGITGGGLASQGMGGGRVNPAGNIRIVNNHIMGVGSHANSGESAASVAQSGGIQLYSGGSGEYMGLLTFGITIKNNVLEDLFPAVEPEELELGSGLVLYFKGGQDNSNNGMRCVIVEDNVVNGSEWGLHIEYEMVGVVVQNNTVSNTTRHDSDVTIDRPMGFVGTAEHTLYVNGQKSDLSGEYAYETLLPEAEAPEGMSFYGWTTDETLTADSVVTTRAYGSNVTLYAVFGYEVTFDYNYKTSEGADRGEFASFTVLKGGNVAADLAVYGDPFRLGCIFDGWYTDKACTQEFDASKAVDSNITVYAKWLDSNGNELPSDTPNDDPGDTPGEITGEPSGVKNAGLIIGLVVAGEAVVAAAVVAGVLLLGKKKG